MILPDNMRETLLRRPSPFIALATSDVQGNPNAGLKFLVKAEGEMIYFVDLPYGQTYENIKKNSKVSFSFYDQETLRCYKIYGSAVIVDKGPEREKMAKEIDSRLNSIIVNRIIEGLHRGRGHADFLTEMPTSFVLFKVKADKIVEYGLKDPRDRTLLE